MIANKEFKREVRARMARTGECYSVAHRAIRMGHPEPMRREDLSKYGSPEELPKND